VTCFSILVAPVISSVLVPFVGVRTMGTPGCSGHNFVMVGRGRRDYRSVVDTEVLGRWCARKRLGGGGRWARSGRRCACWRVRADRWSRRVTWSTPGGVHHFGSVRYRRYWNAQRIGSTPVADGLLPPSEQWDLRSIARVLVFEWSSTAFSRGFGDLGRPDCRTPGMPGAFESPDR
jgi:hypothetical protein